VHVAKRRVSDNTLMQLIVFFGLVSLFTGAKVLAAPSSSPPKP
jgi:hypothetical protein